MEGPNGEQCLKNVRTACILEFDYLIYVLQNYFYLLYPCGSCDLVNSWQRVPQVPDSCT